MQGQNQNRTSRSVYYRVIITHSKCERVLATFMGVGLLMIATSIIKIN